MFMNGVRLITPLNKRNFSNAELPAWHKHRADRRRYHARLRIAKNAGGVAARIAAEDERRRRYDNR